MFVFCVFSKGARHLQQAAQRNAQIAAAMNAQQLVTGSAASTGEQSVLAGQLAASPMVPGAAIVAGGAGDAAAAAGQVGGIAGQAADDNPRRDWQLDSNEQRYCICNDYSYGDMIGCDNDDVSITPSCGICAGNKEVELLFVVLFQCTYEWFHYACVGLTTAPKGKWYCQTCTMAMKRRKR